MSLLCSWWKTAQALAVKCLLAIWQVHGGKNRPWTGLDSYQTRQRSQLKSSVRKAYCESKMKSTLLKVIFKICSTSKLFIYLRQRYDKQQIAVLNNVVKAKGRMRTCKFSTAFLNACILKKVVPTFMANRIRKANVSNNPNMEWFFLKNEIMRNNKQLRTFRTAYRAYWTKAREFLSVFNTIRLCRYLAELDERNERKTKSKHDRLIMIHRRKRFGTVLSDGKKHIQNLSDYVLSDTEEFVLGHGLNFCLPPTNVCKEHLFAELESLWPQLQHHKACFVDK